jgi:TPR repeat protein
LKGDGVPEDKDKARDYLSKAAAQGNQDAATELAKLSAVHPRSACLDVAVKFHG